MASVMPRRPAAPYIRPAALAAAACIALALASLAVRAGPQYDPVGWLIWGRELLHGHLDTIWYPSWKPLPVLVTLPAALAGHGALPVMLVVHRAAGLAGVFAAAWLAHRAAGSFAAVLAALAVLALPQLLPLWLAGAIEPVVAAALLGAVAAGLSGRPRLAIVLLALAALGRVDAWPLLVLWTAWCWRAPAARRARALGVALVVLVPALWAAGDWLGAGNPLRGGVLARASAGAFDAGTGPVLAVLQNVPQVLPVPLLVLAVATAVWGAVRRRPAEIALAAIVVTWLATDLVLAWRGYPTDPRFLMPAAVAGATLAAIGAGHVLGALRRPAPAAALVALCVVAAVVLRAPAADQQIDRAAGAATTLDRLDAVVSRLGGPAGVAACGSAATVQPFRARLAWDLGLPTAAVVGVRHAGLVFMPPGRRYWGVPVRHPGDVSVRYAGSAYGWRILRVTPRAAATAAQQPQRSVSGACRIRSTRAGTPPTTAFSGTSPVTTA